MSFMELNDYFLEILLKDWTTKKNILWATNDYENISAEDEIRLSQIYLIKPRHEKIREKQKNRTKERAEVFTPPRICNLQNNLIDESFGELFWQDYVKKKILEITCGEAPYLVSRYNAVTGEKILLENRVGILDRKLKLVNENTTTSKDWLEWAKKSVQSVYGYELQGDSLFLARKNIFLTAAEYFREKFNCDAPPGFFHDVAEIISWNLWQMDGADFTAPFSKQPAAQVNLFVESHEKIPCKIKDWDNEDEQIFFKDLAEGRRL